MRRLALLLLSLASVAHAEPPAQNPRELFGLPSKEPAEPPLDCSDGRDFGCARATDPLDASDAPFALASWLSSDYLLELPVDNATQDQVASYALGAARTVAGLSFAGATGLENRWLVDGAPADSVRTGIADTRLPLVFLDGIHVTAGGFSARDRASLGGVIDAELKRGGEHHELDARVWASWTAAARHRPILPGTYQIRRGQVDAGPDAEAALVATGPLGDLLGGTGWYAAGVAPAIVATDFTWKAGRLTDRDHDGVPDGLPGLVSTETIETTEKTPITWHVPFMLRGGLDRGAHHLALSVVGDVGTDVFYLYNSTLRAAGIDHDHAVGDAIATWRGTWAHTHARAQLAWHRSTTRESARDPSAANVPQLLTAYVPALQEDPALSEACVDDQPSDPYPDITNCPVPVGWFASGGAGKLVDTTGDRPSVTADLAHQVGKHVLRIGGTGEDARLVTESRFTGGEQIRSLFPGHTSVRHFIDPDQPCPDDPSRPCPYADRSVLRYRTRYTAAYVEDTWSATPDVTVDGGLRWELMWVGPALHFSHELAPRLGMSWDPLGEGRSRVWTSMGRSFALLPAGLGSTILARDRVVDDISSDFGSGRSVDTGAPYPVAPGLAPIARDELTAGAQVAIRHAVRATVWVQGAWLDRGLETTDGQLDNPGRSGELPARRSTQIVAAELQTDPTASFTLRAGYMYGRSVGSWAGPYNPREGAVLYAGSDWDTASTNLSGPLPTELGQRLFVEAQGHGTVGPVRLGVATRMTLASGAPRDVLADGADGIIYLVPRGSAGREPMVTQVNLRLAAHWRGLDVTLDVFDLFDRRTATEVDPIFASGSFRPIDHGELPDVVFLKDELGRNAQRRASYQVATDYQAPLAVVLGIRHAF